MIHVGLGFPFYIYITQNEWLDIELILFTKVNSKWITDLNVKREAINSTASTEKAQWLTSSSVGSWPNGAMKRIVKSMIDKSRNLRWIGKEVKERGWWVGNMWKGCCAGKPDDVKEGEVEQTNCKDRRIWAVKRMLESLNLVVEHLQVIARAGLWLTHLY